jgi:hypothetical protein
MSRIWSKVSSICSWAEVSCIRWKSEWSEKNPHREQNFYTPWGTLIPLGIHAHHCKELQALWPRNMSDENVCMYHFVIMNWGILTQMFIIMKLVVTDINHVQICIAISQGYNVQILFGEYCHYAWRDDFSTMYFCLFWLHVHHNKT